MNSKKVTLIIGSLVIIGGLVIGISTVQNSETNNNFESKVQQHIDLEKTEGNVVARVNDLEITNNKLKQARLFRDDNISDSELLDILISDAILLNEAKKRNLEVDKNEVKAYMNENRKLISEDPIGQKNIETICENLNISEDEYWDTIVFEDYYERALRGNVKNEIMNVLKTRSNYEANDREKIEADFRIELEKLKKEYRIEIY
ncbi:MAG: hypothetical protein ACRCTZ_02310 [Sarcina sp.]